MESELLIGWQQQKAELEQEVSRLQEELAESRAEREELESRSRALTDRVRRRRRSCVNQVKTDHHTWFFPQLRQTLSPSLSTSIHEQEEQRRWRKKLREGREREARQALLIHRLQNKVRTLEGGSSWT